MNRILVILIVSIFLGDVAAAASLNEMLSDASSCSDISLRDYAAHTCDSPQTIAAQAVATCQGKWNAVADKAVGPSQDRASPAERSRSLKSYSLAMEDEYMRVAELKAIDLRKANGSCGYE